LGFFIDVILPVTLRPLALDSTHSLRERSDRNIFWEIKAAGREEWASLIKEAKAKLKGP
jgi:hypothetical protein